MRAAGVHIKKSADLIAEAEKSIQTETANQITFHGVGGDWHSIDTSPFIELLDYLTDKRDLIWVTDHISSYKYQKLFLNTKITKLNRTENSFSFKLISKISDRLFLDEKLTLSFQFPEDCRKIQIFKDSKKINFRIRKNRVYFDVLPDESEIKIEKF